jgi:hypothetical protein
MHPLDRFVAMLSTITIAKAKDGNGQEITLEIAFQPEFGLSAYVASPRARLSLLMT